MQFCFFINTYGLPMLTTNCSNNYGPYQFPEKLILLMILNAVEDRPLPVYGDGQNIRGWLYVEDHCRLFGLMVGRMSLDNALLRFTAANASQGNWY